MSADRSGVNLVEVSAELSRLTEELQRLAKRVPPRLDSLFLQAIRDLGRAEGRLAGMASCAGAEITPILTPRPMDGSAAITTESLDYIIGRLWQTLEALQETPTNAGGALVYVSCALGRARGMRDYQVHDAPPRCAQKSDRSGAPVPVPRAARSGSTDPDRRADDAILQPFHQDSSGQ